MGEKFKHVIVTGSNGGIGRSICKTLHENQYIVWPFKGDVSNKENWENLLCDIQPDIWAVINCAGIAEAKPIFEVSETKFIEMMRVNCLSILHSIQVIGKRMSEYVPIKKLPITTVTGHIINITSISSLTGFSTHAHYCASKFAANGLMQVAAKELAQYGILVNNVCPGPTQTKMWEKLDKEYSQINGVDIGEMNYMSKQLIKRIGKPEDTANVVKWLISNDNEYMTGTNVKVCGGNILG